MSKQRLGRRTPYWFLAGSWGLRSCGGGGEHRRGGDRDFVWRGGRGARRRCQSSGSAAALHIGFLQDRGVCVLVAVAVNIVVAVIAISSGEAVVERDEDVKAAARPPHSILVSCG